MCMPKLSLFLTGILCFARQMAIIGNIETSNRLSNMHICTVSLILADGVGLDALELMGADK